MAIPQFHSEGIDQSGGAASLVPFFTGFTWSAGDIIELIIATDGWVPVLSTANGFVLAADPAGNTASITTNAGTVGTADCGIHVYWKRATGSSTTTDPPPVFQAPSVSGGTSWCCQPNSFSGARATGTPYHVITKAIVTTATTAVTSVAATSTLANCLFMPRVASANDDSVFNSWTFTGSASPSGTGTPNTGWHNSTGNACAFTGAEGGFATAGGPRTATTTFGATTKQASVTLVMASLAETSGPAGTSSVTSNASQATTVGTVRVTGTTTAALAATQGSSSGKVAVTGTSTATTDQTRGSGSGIVSPLIINATSTTTSDAVVASTIGTVVSGIAGTSTGTTGKTQASTIGAVAITGSTAGTLGSTTALTTGTITGGIPISGVSNRTLVGSAGAVSGAVAITAGSTARLAGSSGFASANSVALSLGACGIRQKANGTSPASGTLSSFGVYPAWTPSTVYTMDQAVRVTNAGKIYELAIPSPTANGTSASSGGPSTTGLAIADGTCHWNYLDTGTGACNTQASGSLVLCSIGRGIWNPPNTGPSDNKGNTFTSLGQHNYLAPFTGSGQQVSYTTGAGGTGHSCVGSFQGNDEITCVLVEVQGGAIVQDHSYVENAQVANVVTSSPVTTTGPAILVAFWWMNGVVRPSGQKHKAVPDAPFTRIEEASALMELSPGGAGQVQVATTWAFMPTAGTYTANITTDQSEGSAVYLVAVQATPGAVGVSTVMDAQSSGTTIGHVLSTIQGNAAITVGSDAPVGTGSITLRAVGAVTLNNDALLGSGSVTLRGAGSTSQQADTLGGTGSIQLIGSAGIVLAGDVASGVGETANRGHADIIFENDSIAGTTSIALNGSASIQNAGDFIVATASVALDGQGIFTLGDDAVEATSTVAIGASGTITFTDDISAGVGSTKVNAVAMIALDNDTLVSHGSVTNTGLGSISIDGMDTLTGAGSVLLRATGVLFLAGDSIDGTQSIPPINGNGGAPGEDSILAGTGSVLLRGNGAIQVEGDAVKSIPLHRHTFGTMAGSMRTRRVHIIVRD